MAAGSLVVTTTGQYVELIDPDRLTGAQIRAWVYELKDTFEHMQSIDEVNTAVAMLDAVARRLKQLGDDASDAQRAKIEALRRIGDLLGPGKRGNPAGTNQYTGAILEDHKIAPATQSQMQQNHQARVIAQNWEIIAPILPELQRPTVNKVLREIRRVTQKTEVTEGGEAVISCASCYDWLRQQQPCDLLLTDPPYATDIEDIAGFAAEWLPLALGLVKPTGRAYVCIGPYPHELRAYLSVPYPHHLTLTQILVWTYRNTLGPTPKYDYKNNWQAILYYRGIDAPPLDSPEMLEQFSVTELNHPSGIGGDRWHPWQKPDGLAERFIRHSTRPGDTVLDPFAGSGTHLLAAARLGRRGYGCDILPETVAIAVQRGCHEG